MPTEQGKILRLGNPHKSRILLFESGFKNRTREGFPPKSILEVISCLPKINNSATKLREVRDENILKDAGQQSYIIDVGKSSAKERERFERLKKLNPNIVLVSDIDLVDPILRNICTEIVSFNKDGGNTRGAIAFRVFMEELFSFHQVDILNEWNRFVANHESTKDAVSPFNTHHYSNVGLKTGSEEDGLRDEVVNFVNEIMNDPIFMTVEKSLFNNDLRIKHKHFDNPDDAIKSFNNFLLVLGMAMFSNFVRGGILVRGRKEDENFFTTIKEKKEYKPRRLAAEVMDEVNAVLK